VVGVVRAILLGAQFQIFQAEVLSGVSGRSRVCPLSATAMSEGELAVQKPCSQCSKVPDSSDHACAGRCGRNLHSYLLCDKACITEGNEHEGALVYYCTLCVESKEDLAHLRAKLPNKMFMIDDIGNGNETDSEVELVDGNETDEHERDDEDYDDDDDDESDGRRRRRNMGVAKSCVAKGVAKGEAKSKGGNDPKGKPGDVPAEATKHRTKTDSSHKTKGDGLPQTTTPVPKPQIEAEEKLFDLLLGGLNADTRNEGVIVPSMDLRIFKGYSHAREFPLTNKKWAAVVIKPPNNFYGRHVLSCVGVLQTTSGPSAAAPEAGNATMDAMHVAETVTVQAGTSLGDVAAVLDSIVEQVIAMAETQVGDTLLRAAGRGATPLELGTSSRSFSKRVFVGGTILKSANPDISGKYFLQALYSRFDKKDDIYAVVIAIDATSRAAFDIDIQNPFFRSVWSDLSEPRNDTLCKTYSANAFFQDQGLVYNANRGIPSK